MKKVLIGGLAIFLLLKLSGSDSELQPKNPNDPSELFEEESHYGGTHSNEGKCTRCKYNYQNHNNSSFRWAPPLR